MAARGLLSRLASADPSRPVDEVHSIVGNLRAILNTRLGDSMAAKGFGVGDFVDLVHQFPSAAQTIRDVTATPPPTATATPPTTPTPSTANLPDFSPSDARFVFADRGRAALRVTIKNDGADFSGPLVIEAVTSPGSLLVSPLVFDINLRTGRVATVDFEVTGALPDRADVTVRVDPENAIEESNEDNNTVGFTGVRAPADPPEISISSATIVDGQINVTVTNLGGQLAPTEVSVVVEVGTNQSQSKRVLSLDTDESAHFQVPVPAAGTATVRVLLNGATAATGTVQIPGTATATATTAATTTGTPTP